MLLQSINVNSESIVIFVFFESLFEKYIFVSFQTAFLIRDLFYFTTELAASISQDLQHEKGPPTEIQ